MSDINKQIEKILDDFAYAIQSGDMVLDVKEMETIPQLLALIQQESNRARKDEQDWFRWVIRDCEINSSYLSKEQLADHLQHELEKRLEQLESGQDD